MQTNNKKVSYYFIAIIAFILLYLLFTYPDRHRQLAGPYIEIEGIVLDKAADTFQVGENYNNREIRTYVTLRDKDGKMWQFLEPISPSKSYKENKPGVGNYVIIKAGFEKETNMYVIISAQRVVVPKE